MHDESRLVCADNLGALRDLADETADLIYADPPFLTSRDFGDFDDRWEGPEDYIAWIRERMVEMHRLLAESGSLYLHCDWHASHRLKLMLNEVFGEDCFQNEIIWRYRGGAVSPRRWGRRHDVLFFYSKGKDWTFNVDQVREPYSEASQERLRHRSRAFRGERVFEFEPNALGKHPDDVWDIQPVMPSSKKRLGYPTQKPEALLERVILASSNPGDLVLDPFCGSGTTLAVAERLGRRWIGIDENPRAIEITQKRLLNLQHAVPFAA